jgi:hypothetical protein
MSSVVISGDTSGSITLQAPAVAGSNTFTLPAATGTVMVSGNMPAFSAYLSGSDQTISDATTTKITFNAEEFDTNNNFDSTTNYRFTPTVAGYYQINCCAVYRQNPMIDSVILLYKNGSSFKRGYEFSIAAGATVTNMGMMISTLVYMNGSTDYLEVYAYSDGSGTPNLTLINGASQTYFQGILVRSA